MARPHSSLLSVHLNCVNDLLLVPAAAAGALDPNDADVFCPPICADRTRTRASECARPINIYSIIARCVPAPCASARRTRTRLSVCVPNVLQICADLWTVIRAWSGMATTTTRATVKRFQLFIMFLTRCPRLIDVRTDV